MLRKIDGKVWLLSAEEGTVTALQQNYRVTNIASDEKTGKALLRVLSEEKPDESARTAEPTLEDYYLYVFGDAASEPSN